MAEFNPFLPQPNIPDWTNAPGRLIDGSGLGEIFGKLAVNVAETYGTAKQNKAAVDLYDSADAAAEQGRTEALANAAGVPLDVAQGMKKADLFKRAFASGKFSEADFFRKMDVWSKEMRVRYPQYKELVDQQLTRVMGRTPANLEMDAVRQQIEGELTASSAAAGKDQTFLKEVSEKGALTGEEIIEYQNAPAGSEVRQKLKTKALLLMSDRANFDHANKVLEQNVKAGALEAAPVVSQLASNIERQVYLGAIGKAGSLQQLRAEIERMREGGFTPEETQIANTLITDAKASVDQAWLAGTTTPNETGKALADYFASDPTAWNAQLKRIEQIKADLDGLLTGKAGVFEWNATAASALTNQQVQDFRNKIGPDFYDGFEGLKKLIGDDNANTLYQSISQSEGKDPIKDYMTGLLTGTALKNDSIGSVADAVSSVDPSLRSAANQGVRQTVEALVQTATNKDFPVEGRKKAAMTLYSDPENKFLRSLKDVPDSSGRSSREKAFIRLTSPEQEKMMKELGLEKEYTAWVKNTSPALYATVVEEVNATNTGTKYLDVTFNPNTLKAEIKLNRSLIKDPAKLEKYLSQIRSGKPVSTSSIPSDIPVEDLDQIKAGIDAVQKLNLINDALARALKSENPGMKQEDLVKAIDGYMGDFAKSYAKDEYWQTKVWNAIGTFIKENSALTGGIEKGRKQNQKDLDGENFGVIPEGDVSFNALEGGSVTSPVGTTPDTGDDTANAVLAFIHGAEGADYNTVFGGGKVDAAGMTVADVLARTENAGSSAFGAVQVMKKTLQGLVKNGVVAPDQKMDQATQDKIGLALMKEAGYDDWKAGKLSDNVFADNLASIWASLPVKGGKSKYEADGVNKARVTRGQVLALLDDLR